eukprot:1466768-Prymnesium_polylepis.1
MDAADLRIAAPDRPEPPRPRHALAVPSPQARASSLGSAAQPGRAGPGAAWEERALYTACIGFNFALQTPIYTSCAPAATPRPSHATPVGPHALAV